MKKNFGLILMFVIVGCAKKENDYPTFPTVTIHYIDSNYQDLFNNGPNEYVFDSIRAYSYQNGTKIKLSSPSVDYPNGFGPNPVYPTSGIKIGSHNDYKVDRYTITVIHLKMGVDDTLKMHFADDLPTQYSICDGAWYNGIRIQDTVTIMKSK